MKLTTILILLGCLQVSATAYSQEKNISLSLTNAPLQQVIKSIQDQSNYQFLYNNEKLNGLQKITVHVKNATISQVMDDCLKELPLSYKIIDETVIITPKKTIPNSVQKATQNSLQLIIINGTVRDSTGHPLIGVSVKVQDTNKGTITDANGHFTLELSDKGEILIFSYIGYQTKTVAINGKTSIEVVLKENASQLDQLVVVGYGTQKKGDLTGATTVVDTALLRSRPAANVSSLLQGTVPNLQVKFSSGMPGTNGSFNIRGVNSISSSAKPLIIIDGFEGDIDRLNPNDIESITVLKDASAAAVYGARASYGVILITTKSGNKNKSVITYSGQTSFSRSTTSTDYETRGYYSAAINDLFYTNYAGTPYTRYTDDDYYQLYIRRNDKTENPDRPWVTVQKRNGRDEYVYYANTDWFNHLFNMSRPMQDHNISVSGGSDEITYRLSGSYYSQDGIFRKDPDRFKRYNLRSKVGFKVKKWLHINSDLSYYSSSYSYPGYSGVQNTFSAMAVHGLASIAPVNPDGTLVYNTTTSNYSVMDGRSALLDYDGHRNEDRRSAFSPTIEAVLKPLKGLDIRASYRFTQYNYRSMNRSVNIPYSKYPGEVEYITSDIGVNRLSEINTVHEYQAVNSYATYERTVNNVHDFKVMAGLNYETKYLKDVKPSREGLLSDDINDFNVATGDVIDIGGGQNEYKLFGVFYRLNYSYKDKYLFEASGRYDGTSRFAKGHRYGFFPSFSAGWRVEQEKFFKNWEQNTIDNLKLRFSYGSLGNQQIGYYDYIQTISAGGNLSYTFGDGTLAGYASESSPNSTALTWETVKTTNLGLDMGMLKSRLNFSIDVYQRATLNMLTAGKTLPAYYGASVPRENAADLMTKGWEVSINWKDKIKLFEKNLDYYFGVGVGDNISKITRFDNPNENLSNFYKGQNLGDIWGYVVNGFFKTDDEASKYDVDQTSVNTIVNTSAIDPGVHAGDLKFEDLDGDKTITVGDNTLDNPGDRKIIGNSLPRYNYNISLGGSWNNIDISVFAQGIGHQDWYPGRDAAGFWGTYSRPYVTFIPSNFLSQVWSEDNPNAYFPRPRGYTALNASNRELGVPSTKYLQNLMYLRLKNITIGYTLPHKIAEKIGVTQFRVYFSGENLFTYTTLHSKYIDPEQASASNDYNTSSSNAKIYPWAKTFTFGLDISL